MNDYAHINVLVVDDEPGICESLSAFLDDYGFNTAYCYSTEEARELMRDQIFDVCIVDLRLPGLSGEDLILLASKRYPQQRYIIHTGSISYLLPEKLQNIGIRPEHIFHKPVRVLTLLVKCIKELVQQRNEGDAIPRGTPE